MKNLCAKTRPDNLPYEIWQNPATFNVGGDPQPPNSWIWFVLKKWQADDNKSLARWFCKVFTPIVPEGELGDVYVRDIKSVAHKLNQEEAGELINLMIEDGRLQPFLKP